jgi:hypothetical protein
VSAFPFIAGRQREPYGDAAAGWYFLSPFLLTPLARRLKAGAGKSVIQGVFS